MHRPRPKRAHPVLIGLVVLASIGLVAAVFHKRARRMEIERSRPAAEVVEESIIISTQVLSFRVEAPVELEGEEDLSKSLLMSARPEKPSAPIIHTEVSVRSAGAERTENEVTREENEALKKAGDKKPEKIVVE